MKTKSRVFRILPIFAIAIITLVFALVFSLGANAANLPGLSFTASNHYKMTGHVMPGGNITLEAEIYVPEAYRTQRAGAIISNYNNGTYKNAYAFEVMQNGKIRVFTQSYGDLQLDYNITQHMGTDSAPKYAKIAVSIDTTSGNIILYVNGEQKATAKNASVIKDMYNTNGVNGASTSNMLCIGGDERPNNAQYFKGIINNVVMYSEIRSAEQIANDCGSSFYDATASTLLFAYDMTKAYDGFIEDESANKNHANDTNWTATEGMSFADLDNVLYLTKNYQEVPLTYETVLYAPTSENRPGVVIGNYPNASGDAINFEIYTGGKPALYIWENGEVKTNYKFNYDIRRNAYVHLVITQETVLNASTNQKDTLFKCYVNGELVDTFTKENYVFTMDMAKMQEKTLISLGRDVRDAQKYKGKIKNIALHSRTLSEAEIKANYENGVNVASNDLIAYYDLTSSSSTESSVNDASGNGYNMKTFFYEKDFTTEDYDYCFAVIGDTQFMVYNDAIYGTDYTRYIYDYIVDNVDSKKIKYVFGLGDIIDNGKHPETNLSTRNEEYAYAEQVIIGTLGANNIPYSLIGGNHDFMRPSDVGYNATFKDEESLTKNITGYYSGTDVYNYYMNFEVGGTEYMLLALEYGANDEILAWANSVISQNRHRSVIITTHGYMNFDGTTLDGGDTAAPKPNGTTNQNYLKYNNGDEMWDEMVRKHPNVIMVLSGHIDYNEIVMREDKGDYGNTVHQFLIDPQKMDRAYGFKTGMVAMFYFRNGGKDVSVEYVSTYQTAKNNGKEVLYREHNQFDFTIQEAPKQEDKGEINVWLIGGQSNAAGYGKNLTDTDIRFTDGFENILYYGYSEKWSSSFVPVTIGLGNSASSSGAEIGIAKALGNTGQMNAIIKYAEGASCICPSTTDVDAQRNGTWTSPSYIKNNSISTDGTKVGLLYNNFINTVKSAITELERMGYTPVVKGMWWMQGEAETYIDAQIGANQYDKLLSALISDVRTDVGNIVGENLDSMPFVFGKIYRNPNSSTMAHLETVQAKQELVASTVANTAIVYPNAYESFYQQDGWHYDANTQKYLGQSFVEKACVLNGDIIVTTDNDYIKLTGGGLYSKNEIKTVAVGFDTCIEGMGVVEITKTIDGLTPEVITLTNGSYELTLNGKSVIFSATLDYKETETDYGTIPPTHSNPSSSPVVLFTADGSFLGSYSDIADAANAAIEKGANGNYVILLRNNISQNKNAFISNLKGSITIDLGGYTVTKSGTKYIIEAYYNAAGVDAGKLTVKNGAMVNTEWSGLFCYNYGSGLSSDANIEFEFDNVTFSSVTTNGEGRSVIMDTFEDGAGNANHITATVTFNDCTFDYTGAAVKEIMLSLTNKSSSGAIFKVTVNGGKVISDRTVNFADFAKTDSLDSVIFDKGSNGYTKFELSSGIEASTDNFKTTKGNTLSLSLSSSVDGKTIYTLGENVHTEYGIIPFKYTDASVYPYAVFRNGTFIGAYSDWGLDNSLSALSQSKTAGSVILLRANAKNPAGTQYNNLSQTNDLLIDLGGFTFDSSSRAMFVAQKKTNTNTTIKVKNGTVILGSHGLIVLDTWTPTNNPYTGNNGYNITFESVGITLKENATTNNVICYNSFAESDPKQFANLTFNDCVFDLTGSNKASLVMFDMSDAHCKVTAIINGGRIIAGDTSVVFAKTTTNDSSLSFGMQDGKYTELSALNSVAAPAGEWNGFVFAKVSENENTVIYRITKKVVADLNFTPKVSITLDSSLVLNIYVPQNSKLNSFSVDGTLYTDFDALDKHDSYYLVTIPLNAETSAREITLICNVDTVGTGTFKFSTVKYVQKLLATAGVTETEKTLAKDMLAYVKSAYNYFDSADKATVADEIDAVIGNYSKTDIDRVDASESKDNDDIIAGATLVLDSTPAIRFYISSYFDSADYVFSVNGKAIACEFKQEDADNEYNNLYYTDISLYAYQMVEEITITCDSSSANYHINAYYDSVDKSDAELVDIVEKFYNYCVSASAYRNSVINKQ